MKAKTIRQSVTFNASPHDVYEALMDSKKHSEFTGEKASISKKVGGKFTAYGDYIEGTNLKLAQDKLIVQKWRASDWPKNHYSTATFKLQKVSGGTRLMFTQTNVPEDQSESISDGWKEFYWDNMKKMFG